MTRLYFIHACMLRNLEEIQFSISRLDRGFFLVLLFFLNATFEVWLVTLLE